MSTSETEPPKFGLPIVTCPACGKHMTLSTILPIEENHERMAFRCECGADFQQTRNINADYG